jgi:hypothetical protein
MAVVPAEAQVTVGLEVPVEAVVAEVLHLLEVEQVYSHLMILHTVQNLHQEHPVDMVILAVPGVPQYQEQIQQAHLVQEAVELEVPAGLVQILQGDRVNFIV